MVASKKLKTKKTKKPKTKTLKLTPAPTQGIARMAVSINPPEGYRFESMERRGTEATITYRLIEEEGPEPAQ